MNTFSSMGEAEGAAMAHNARMAADLARLTTVRAGTTPEPSAMSVPLSDTRLFGVVFDRPDADRIFAWGPFADRDAAARFAEFVTAEIDPARVIPWADAQALPGVRVADPVAELLTWRTTVALSQNAELDRLRAVITRAQNAADGADMVAVRAALAGPKLSQPLPEAELVDETTAPFRNCFTDEAYRSSLTDSPERPCDRVQAHPAHKHVAQRASWQCPGVTAPSA